MTTIRSRVATACASFLVFVSVASAQPILSNSCRTWLFRNSTGGAADDIHIVFNGLGAGVTFVLENVVLPPVTSPNCPGYTWACGGGPVMDIFFAPGPIGPGQWVAVSVSTTGGFPTLSAASPPRWNFTPGGVGVVAEVFDPPTLVISEVSTGAVDWIELANYGPSIDIGGYRVDVYEDPGTVSTIYTFPTPYILLTCHRIVFTDSAVAPVLGCVMATSIVVPNIPYNLTKEGAVYVIAPPAAAAGGPERPVDGMAFGYFRDNLLFHPDFPLPDAVQNYTDDDANEEQVTLYRVESCLRFAADSWHNQQVPFTILGPGGAEAHTSSATPGCPNPGECLTPFSCPGMKSLTLRVSKCPLVVHVDGAEPGAEVLIMISTDLHATQNSGTAGGLNIGSSLLWTLYTGCFAAPFRGPAVIASPCGASARIFERNFGFLPGLPICMEISAFSLVRGQGAGAPMVQVLSNVVRIP